MNEQRNANLMVVDCGIFSALSIVLLFIALMVPVINIIALLVMAVPTMVLMMRQNFVAACLSVLVVTSVGVLLAGPIYGLSAGILIAGFGLVYGVCFKKGVKPLKTLFFGAVTAAVVTCCSLIFSVYIGGIPLSGFIENLEAGFEQTLAVYEEAGLLQSMIPAGMTAAEYIEYAMDLMLRLLPAVAISYVMITAAVNYIVASQVMKRLRYDIVLLPPFRQWHFPWWSLWGIIIALVAYLMGHYFDHERYFVIAENIFLIYVPIFAVSGISLVTCILKRFQLTTAFHVLFWVFVFLFPSFMVPLILIFGALDIIVDYRKLMRRRNEIKRD